GLIGKTLHHSFSQKYFRQKFFEENISNTDYLLFELATIDELPDVFKQHPALGGLNVTIPYKLEVMSFLDEIDPVAEEIGAVNTVKIGTTGLKIGYNTDYFGFKISLENWIHKPLSDYKALVLGTGGAS